MNRPLLQLPRWQLRLLILTGSLLLASGGGWLLVHYLWGAGAGELPHAWELPLIRLHGAAAFAGLFTLGMLAGQHVPNGWRATRHGHGALHHLELVRARGHAPASRTDRRRWQRRSGMLLLALAALLVATGYTLYYFAPEDWRPALGWLHAGFGAMVAISAFWHAARRRR